MKLDTNLAWQQATAAIAANRDVLLALAGVFFLLPSLAFALFLPQPEPVPGQSPEQMMAGQQAYLLSALPYMIPMGILQALGTLAMLTLFTDRTRPTVGEAIRQGAAGLLSYFGAQILLGLGVGVAGGLLLGIAAATGAKALVALSVIAVLVALVFVAIRTSLVSPVIAVEGERSPVAALKRSWALTSGNGGRMLLFFLLVVVAFVVVMLVLMGIVGVVLALVGGAGAAKIGGTVVSSALGAVMTVYFVAILAAVHRQLAGPSDPAAPFE